jgi:hypothetical protein
MKPADVEYWALQAIDRVVAKHGVEDSRVELKRAWPTEPNRAARRLAGHANAARGEPILWLIGVDENTGPVGVEKIELSSWWAQVSSQFDGIAPDMLADLAVSTRDVVVHALLFGTARPPYVVKLDPSTRSNSALEVPWREGTSVRSARREDLIRLLVPAVRVPEVDLVDGFFAASGGSWELELVLYLTPASDDQVVVPFRNCSVKCTLAAWNLDAARVQLSAAATDGGLITNTHSELIIHGPGEVMLRAEPYNFIGTGSLENDLKDIRSNMAISLTLLPSHAALPLVIEAVLFRHRHEDRGVKWYLTEDPFEVLARDKSE